MDQDSIDAHIQGQISGQVAVGSNILQIGPVEGGVVNVAPPQAQRVPRPRRVPVLLRPRPFPDFLNRQTEVGEATRAVPSGLPVEFYGEAGVGKTSLLRHLAYESFPMPDGAVFLSAERHLVGDLLQFLFDAFYESDEAVKPTEGQLRQGLQGKQAVILLDDVDLARDDVTLLLDGAPRCAFLFTSTERRLWGEGQSFALPGLPDDDAMTLVAQEEGHALTTDERTASTELYTTLGRNPLHLLQAAATARAESRPLAEIQQQLPAGSPQEAISTVAIQALPQPERQVVGALASVGGAGIHASDVGALAEVSDAAPALDSLVARHIAETDDRRYRVVIPLGPAAERLLDIPSRAQRALAYFTTGAEEHRSSPETILEEADAILRLLEWALQNGHYAEVVRLVRAVESALALGLRWAAWAQVLQWGLQAARAVGDGSAQAFALHQLGTRALCLEDGPEAQTLLTQALELRESLGDELGAAVTRHNLGLIGALPVSQEIAPQQPVERRLPIPPWALALALAAILLVVLAGVGRAEGWWLKPSPTPIPSVVPSVQPSSTIAPATTTTAPTATPAATSTPAPSDTPSPTDTPKPSTTSPVG